MGKVSKWFRGLLGLKKTDYSASPAKPLKEKRRWSFVRPSYTDKYNTTDATCTPYRDDNNKNNNHAMAVAAATAAVAEAAVAAAEAAAVVVRLTSNSGRCADAGATRIHQHWAAVKIQAAFRGCLARRALRALKGLVKLQALARGHIERKRTAEWLKRVQALLHAQAEVSAGLTLHASPSTAKLSTHLHLSGPETPEKFESPIRSKSMKYEQSPILKRNGSKSCVLVNGYQEISGSRSESQVNEQSCNSGISLIRTYSSNDERNDRVFEIESGKPHFSLKRRNLSYSTGCDHYSKSLNSTKESTSLQSGQSPSCEIQSYNSYSSQKVSEVEESLFCTADNSPQFLSATSKDDGLKRSPFTPTRSDGSTSYLRGYPDYPSYMACTQSSKAKVRSLSAPKQRPQSERSGSSNRYSLNGFDMSRLATQRAMHASFTNKAYPGSGRLDKLGMPVGYRY